MRSPKDSSAARDLVGTGADHRLAVHRVADRIRVGRSGRLRPGERTGVPLGDLDLLEDEREVGGRDDEALADGGRGPPWRPATRSARVPVGSIATPVHASAATSVHVRGRVNWPSTDRRRGTRRPSGGERCIWCVLYGGGTPTGESPVRTRGVRGPPPSDGRLSDPFQKAFQRLPITFSKAAEFRSETGQTPALACFMCGFSTPTRVLAASTLDPKSTVARPAAGQLRAGRGGQRDRRRGSSAAPTASSTGVRGSSTRTRRSPARRGLHGGRGTASAADPDPHPASAPGRAIAAVRPPPRTTDAPRRRCRRGARVELSCPES